MDISLQQVIQKRMEKTAKALAENNMEVHTVKTADEARELVKKLMPKGSTAASGGSATLKESGIIDLLRSGDYTYYDRDGAEDVEEIFRKAFSCDFYLASANAVTENGEIYNVDGNSNRVSAILFGPQSVILVVGSNKIVGSINDAVKRVKHTAAPPNCIRLSRRTPCAETGECISLSKCGAAMPDGCKSPERICCNYTVMSYQRKKDRIKVILVEQPLGF